MTKVKKRAARRFKVVDTTEGQSVAVDPQAVGETDVEAGVATVFATEIIGVAAQRDLSDAQLLQAALTVVARLLQHESSEVRH